MLDEKKAIRLGRLDTHTQLALGAPITIVGEGNTPFVWLEQHSIDAIAQANPSDYLLLIHYISQAVKKPVYGAYDRVNDTYYLITDFFDGSTFKKVCVEAKQEGNYLIAKMFYYLSDDKARDINKRFGIVNILCHNLKGIAEESKMIVSKKEKGVTK